MLFQLAAIAIAVKGMDISIVGLLGLKAFSSWNLSPEFYMEANVLWSTLIQAVDRKAIAQSFVLCFFQQFILKLSNSFTKKFWIGGIYF